MELCWLSNSAPKATLCTWLLEGCRGLGPGSSCASSEGLESSSFGALLPWLVSVPWFWQSGDPGAGSGTRPGDREPWYLTEASILSICSLLVVLCPVPFSWGTATEEKLYSVFMTLCRMLALSLVCQLCYRLSVTLVLTSAPEFCNQPYLIPVPRYFRRYGFIFFSWPDNLGTVTLNTN